MNLWDVGHNYLLLSWLSILDYKRGYHGKTLFLQIQQPKYHYHVLLFPLLRKFVTSKHAKHNNISEDAAVTQYISALKMLT